MVQTSDVPSSGADEGDALLRLLASAHEVSMTHQAGPDGLYSDCWSCWNRLVPQRRVA
jgi:hypothetical protein